MTSLYEFEVIPLDSHLPRLKLFGSSVGFDSDDAAYDIRDEDDDIVAVVPSGNIYAIVAVYYGELEDEG